MWQCWSLAQAQASLEESMTQKVAVQWSLVPGLQRGSHDQLVPGKETKFMTFFKLIVPNFTKCKINVYLWVYNLFSLHLCIPAKVRLISSILIHPSPSLSLICCSETLFLFYSSLTNKNLVPISKHKNLTF